MEWIAKKYCDEKWDVAIKKSKNKKVICYSAGIALELMPVLFGDDINIEYHIDNNFKNYASNRVKVFSPEILKTEKRGDFFVYICGQHTISMKEQLESYGLVEEEDFINLYGQFEKVFRIAKHDYLANRMIDYICKYPQKPMRTNADEQKYGVVCTCTYMAPFIYDMAICMGLWYQGYDTELIVDDIYTYENISIYEGITEDIRKLCNNVVNVLKEHLEGFKVLYLSSLKKAELDEKDYKLVSKATDITAVWQRSRKIESVLSKSTEEYKKQFEPIFKNNCCYIKELYNIRKYDVLTVFTGVHGQRIFYDEYNKYGRTVTYDGDSGGFRDWSSDGMCSKSMDILKIYEENYFNDVQKEIFIEKAEKDLQRRISYDSEDTGIFDFLNGKTGMVTDSWYDVIIPLNIMNDAAALGANRVFENEKSWLLETVNYIIHNTEANILIRKHPSSKMINYYNQDDFCEEIKKIYSEEKRVFIAESDNKLNTYEYINHSKVILPFTTTVGLEAVAMGKSVVTHTNIYYDRMDFVKSAKDKEEYFELIKEAIENNITIDDEKRRNALLVYWYAMNRYLTSFFSEDSFEWLDLSIEQLLEEDSVQYIYECIIKGIPVYYNTIKSTL